MRSRFVIEKFEGETPLETLVRARRMYDITDDVPLAYAGRLDPMATGKLLVLMGEECKRQRAYHGLDKEYHFEILFGFRSDTGDILGLPEATTVPTIDPIQLKRTLSELVGPIALPYPHFSSKTVSGKPLFLWTLEGRLGEIEIPVAHTHIYKLRLRSIRTISHVTLSRDIQRRIALPTEVTAESKRLGENFRRNTIAPLWEHLLGNPGETTIASCTATVSAGTYIRSLAPYISEQMGTYGLAYAIDRTKIGRFIPIPYTRTGIWLVTYR